LQSWVLRFFAPFPAGLVTSSIRQACLNSKWKYADIVAIPKAQSVKLNILIKDDLLQVWLIKLNIA
jgi:hypothetical protein